LTPPTGCLPIRKSTPRWPWCKPHLFSQRIRLGTFPAKAIAAPSKQGYRVGKPVSWAMI